MINEFVIEAVKEILENRFSSIHKRRLAAYSAMNKSLNFACPFCGDSDSNDKKKRGHLYSETKTYKCWNCGTYCSQKRFFSLCRDNGYLVENIKDEIFEESNYDVIYKSLNSSSNMSFLTYTLEDTINKYAVSKEEFTEWFKCIEIEHTPMEDYLLKRKIYKHSQFLYNEKYNKLYILNVDNVSQKIISYQVRNFNISGNIPKYENYKLSNMYIHMHKELPEDEDFLKLDELSIFFNIFNIDVSKPFYYFEGYLDSCSLKNTVSINSAHLNLPIVTENTRIIYDKDKTGLDVMINALSKRLKVFLWGKFLKDNMIVNDKSRKLDFNQMMIENNNLNLNDIEDYFSNNKLDIVYL